MCFIDARELRVFYYIFINLKGFNVDLSAR